MKHLPLGPLLVVAIAACGGDSNRCENADGFEAAVGELIADSHKASIDLRDVTKFEWTRLDAFGEYSPTERVRMRTGLEYRESWWQHVHVPESHTLLVFTAKEGSVCYVEVENAKSSIAKWSFGPSIFQETGIPVSEARFVVDRSSKIPVLELKAR